MGDLRNIIIRLLTEKKFSFISSWEKLKVRVKLMKEIVKESSHHLQSRPKDSTVGTSVRTHQNKLLLSMEFIEFLIQKRVV